MIAKYYVREFTDNDFRYLPQVDAALKKKQVVPETKETSTGSRLYRINGSDAKKLEFMLNKLAVFYEEHPRRYFAFVEDNEENVWMREEKNEKSGTDYSFPHFF